VQFLGGRPVFIDTLSFGVRREGEPWPGYKQFCQHFLAPLAIMAGTDARLGRLHRIHIDGVPLDLAARLLPITARLRPGLAFHLFLHQRFVRGAGDTTVDRNARRARAARVTESGLLGLFESLESTVSSLRWRRGRTEWGDYYLRTNYSDTAMAHKERIVSEHLERTRPGSVWDLGANVGRFARLASERGIPTVAFDVDDVAVEEGFQETRRRGDERTLHLVQDLTNPSGALGWAHTERASLAERGPADCVLALGLIHHLAIGSNLPLARIVEFLCDIGRTAVVEFVPKTDSQVKRLLAAREDVFDEYRRDRFEQIVERRFEICSREPLRDSERWLYVLRKRDR
jgi:ribosomal protein L11 methylase PrmA